MSEQRCTNCNAVLDSDDQFCGDCGQPISPVAPEPRQAVPPPPPPPAQPEREEPRLPAHAAAAPPPPPQPETAQPMPPAPAAAPPPPPVQQEIPVTPQAAPAPPQSYAPTAPVAGGPQQAPKKRGGLKIGLIGIAVIAVAIICLVGGVLVAKALLDSNSGGDGTAPVLVENDSSYEICYVRISPSSAEEWGEDWLGSNDTIPPGSDYTFYVTSNQSIDMQLFDCTQELLDEQYNIMLDDDGITYTLEDLP